MQLIVISGLSGSGKSIALNVLEDNGYYCVDNLPVGLIPRFAELVVQSSDIERTATLNSSLPFILKKCSPAASVSALGGFRVPPPGE